MAVDPQLISRQMIPLAAAVNTDPSTPPPFTVMSFNLLADSLCDERSFPHTAPQALQWKHRCKLLLDELIGTTRTRISSSSAASHAIESKEPPFDILTVQELDHFFDVFAPALKEHGWTQSYFVGKSAQSASGGKDGVAIFVRPEAFRVKRVQRFKLEGMTQVALIAQLEPRTRAVAATAASSSSSASSAPLPPPHHLYVVTTHLKAAPGFESLRLLQSQMIIHETQRFIARYHEASLQDSVEEEGEVEEKNTQGTRKRNSKRDAQDEEPAIDVTDEQLASPFPLPAGSFRMPSGAALILSGDLNDVPSSPMYAFLSSGVSTDDASRHTKFGVVPATIQKVKQCATLVKGFAWHRMPSVVQTLLAAAWPFSSSKGISTTAAASSAFEPVTHELWLHSLYNRYFSPKDSGKVGHHFGKIYTIAQRRWILTQGCIDYVFFTPDALTPLALLSLPDMQRDLPEFLPNLRYPSDHMAIAGRFGWNKL